LLPDLPQDLLHSIKKLVAVWSILRGGTDRMRKLSSVWF
jgi:hypothetical protein